MDSVVLACSRGADALPAVPRGRAHRSGARVVAVDRGLGAGVLPRVEDRPGGRRGLIPPPGLPRGGRMRLRARP
jgi:hypothetical protein